MEVVVDLKLCGARKENFEATASQDPNLAAWLRGCERVLLFSLLFSPLLLLINNMFLIWCW